MIWQSKFKGYKRSKRVSHRNVSNLCPNCFSTLSLNEAGGFDCSGDRIASWKDEITKYRGMSEDDKKEYLATLANPSKFMDLVGSFDTLDCGYNAKINNVTADYNTRIPDPMAVARLERVLQRTLTAEEMEEGHEFVLEGKSYTLPMINFPDDL